MENLVCKNEDLRSKAFSCVLVHWQLVFCVVDPVAPKLLHLGADGQNLLGTLLGANLI